MTSSLSKQNQRQKSKKLNQKIEMKYWIQRTVATDDVNMLKLSWIELEYRLNLFQGEKVCHVELFEGSIKNNFDLFYLMLKLIMM